MEISVIIPTYKPQKYIWECLNSIKNQTFPKELFELIVVLNGCCEPWNGQLKDFFASDMQGFNVHLIQTDQGGVSNARNIALDVANGEYITFIDDDDYISPKYLEELYQKASPNTISLCYPYFFYDGHPDVQLYGGVNDAYNECYQKNTQRLYSKVRKYFSGPCMKLIPKSFIQDRRFDVRFANGEDCLFMFLISDVIRNLTFTSKEAVYYRRFRDGSAVTKHRSTKDRISNSYRCIKEYFKIFFRGNYNVLFFASRVIAETRNIIYAIMGKYI